jgi:hypothetical protein
LLQCHAIEQLHDEELPPVVFPEVIDCADVLVIKGRGGLRFTLEPGEGMRISGYMIRQKLERDETVETSILSFVDDTHPAATELLDDPVMRDILVDHLAGRNSGVLC